MHLEHLSDSDIYQMLSHLVFDICIKGQSSYAFTNLMIEIFRSRTSYLNFSRATDIKQVIQQYLIMLMLAKTNCDGKTLIELDEPDYTILPKKEKISNVV